jgi:hypothetical protein
VGDTKSGSKAARAGSKQSDGYRRRAVGTRDKIITHLALVTEVTDEGGMASTRLGEAVGYPGSSVAFAQLLSGMERDGLIAREVRGKRTYRITLTAQGRQRQRAGSSGSAASAGARRGRAAARAGSRAGGVAAGTAAATGGGPAMFAGGAAMSAAAGVIPAGADFDYDELARRLLVQVVRRLAASPDELADPRLATSDPVVDPASVEETVSGLERELATAWTRHGTLTAENMKLRQQLRETQRNLDLERRARRMPITDELNRAEAVLLDRLLSPADEGRQPGANAG